MAGIATLAFTVVGDTLFHVEETQSSTTAVSNATVVDITHATIICQVDTPNGTKIYTFNRLDGRGIDDKNPGFIIYPQQMGSKG